MPVARYNDMLSRKAISTQIARQLCSFAACAMHFNYAKQTPLSMFSLHPQYRASDDENKKPTETTGDEEEEQDIEKIKKALTLHAEKFTLNKLLNKFKDSNERDEYMKDEGGPLAMDKNAVAAEFKVFALKHVFPGNKHGKNCERTGLLWQERGLRGSDLRTGKKTEIETDLRNCAKLIDLPDEVTLLFRGTGKEKDSVEEFMSTSMSCAVGLEFYVPLMIIYVPKRRVRGLVICNPKHTLKNRESELLLTQPKPYMTRRKEYEETILQYLRDERLITMFEDTSFTDYLQVWVYDIPPTDPLLTTSNSPH